MDSKSRCPVITVDPDKGIKHSDDEPKKTLKTFRSTFNAQEQLEHKNAPFFGVNLGIDEYGGTINVGDEVEVIKKSQNSWHLLPIFMLFPLPILAMFYDREQSDVLSILQSSFSMICNKARF